VSPSLLNTIALQCANPDQPLSLCATGTVLNRLFTCETPPTSTYCGPTQVYDPIAMVCSNICPATASAMGTGSNGGLPGGRCADLDDPANGAGGDECPFSEYLGVSVTADNE